MSGVRPVVSFIIPAKNEEDLLPSTLDSIYEAVGDKLAYEVIVVDNGSSDKTVELARAKGAYVIIQAGGTIGSLRNEGARQAKGDVFVFIDADVSITDVWSRQLPGLLDDFRGSPDIITGARCYSADNAGWIAESWFCEGASSCNVSHIGSGHMITSSILFKRLMGFDEELYTGEDFEICDRARRLGAAVIENRSLKVIHYGMPKKLIEFMKREVWHGMGDVASLTTLIRSKVALASLVFMAAHIGLLLSFILDDQFSKILFAICLFFVACLCVLSALKRCPGASIKTLLRNTFLFYVYYCCRIASIFYRFVPMLSPRSPRAGR